MLFAAHGLLLLLRKDVPLGEHISCQSSRFEIGDCRFKIAKGGRRLHQSAISNLHSTSLNLPVLVVEKCHNSRFKPVFFSIIKGDETYMAT